jgi:predicted N-acyltransferase
MESRMADVDLTILTSIDQVAAAEWDALCGSRAFVDHRWLRFVESALLDYAPRYVLLRCLGRLEAAALCSVDRRFANPTLQQRAGWLLRRAPCLRCGVPVANECGLVVRPDADEAQLMPTLVRGMRSLAFRERASFTSVGHVPRDAAAWQLLRAAGGTPLSQWRNTTLDINWTSLDDYLAARPRGDRHELRRMRRRAEREGITVQPAPFVRSELGSLWRLIDNVQRHHHADNRYVDELLERALAVLGSDVHLLLARQAGETIGCVVLVRNHDELIAKWIGLDYVRTRNTATYFMSLTACVELAINLRVRRLRLGATAYSTKEQFGVVPEDRVNALLLPTPLGRLANLARAA